MQKKNSGKISLSRVSTGEIFKFSKLFVSTLIFTPLDKNNKNYLFVIYYYIPQTLWKILTSYNVIYQSHSPYFEL
jgi:hypothetical protein